MNVSTVERTWTPSLSGLLLRGLQTVDHHLQEAEQGCAPVGEDVRQIEKGEEGRPGPTYLGRCYDEDPFLSIYITFKQQVRL